MCFVGWGCPKSNERYTKCGGFDKLNHRNANLLDSSLSERRKYKKYDLVKNAYKNWKIQVLQAFFLQKWKLRIKTADVLEWIRKLWEAGWWKGKGDGAEMEWRAAMYGRELRSEAEQWA